MTVTTYYLLKMITYTIGISHVTLSRYSLELRSTCSSDPVNMQLTLNSRANAIAWPYSLQLLHRYFSAKKQYLSLTTNQYKHQYKSRYNNGLIVKLVSIFIDVEERRELGSYFSTKLGTEA